MAQNHRARALQVIRACGVARARDVAAMGVPPIYLQRLCAEGLLVRSGRGLYRLSDSDWTAARSLADVAKAVPKGVICLLSALQFYELTTQLPHLVWVQLGAGEWTPRRPPVGLKIVRASGRSRSEGIVYHQVEGVRVAMTSVAKTVADCFKYRRVVGMDVAVEALRDSLRLRRASRHEIVACARICRVLSVMRPFVEFGL